MSVNYTKVDLRGKAAEHVLAALFFENKTIANRYVAFEDNVKAQTIFTEFDNTVVMQAYTDGVPTSNGGINLRDVEVTPSKWLAYFEYNPDTLRMGRFGSTMQKGAFNVLSSEFDQKVLSKYGPSASSAAESQFWGGIKASDQTIIAALTGATATEKTYAASVASVGQFSGVIAEVIKGNKRVLVSGTTVTSSNIAAEYAKAYAGITSAKLDADSNSETVIYAPLAHKQLVNIANISATYRDIFTKVDGKYFYLDIEILFVPMSSNNVMLIAKKDRVFWCTDLASDNSNVKTDVVSNAGDKMFVKIVATTAAHVANQANVVLYIG